MLVGRRLRLLLLPLTASTVCASCDGPLESRLEIPVALTIEYAGPAASNIEVPTPSVVQAGSTLILRSARGFPSLGYQLRASAYITGSGAARRLRVLVRSVAPERGLDTVGLIVFAVELPQVPSGTFELELVSVDESGVESTELMVSVTIP